MAMSGGIDSTVAALLLQEQGYELVGVTFRVFDPAPCPSAGQPGGCAAADTLLEAGRMAQALGIEHHVADFRRDFEETVKNYILFNLKCNESAYEGFEDMEEDEV